MGTSWRLAWRNIWRNPRRTILTILAIAFGAGLLVFSIGIQLGSYDMMISNSVRVFQGLLQVQKKGYLDEPKMRSSIPDILALTEKIRQQSDITAISARAIGFALISSQKRTNSTLVVGVDPRHEAEVSTIPGVVKEGHYFSNIDTQEVIIGRSMATNMQLHIGDEITILGNGRDGSIAATILPVTGIFESGSRELDRNFIQMPIKTFQDTFSMGDEGHSIVIYHPDAKLELQLQQQIQQILVDHPDLDVLTWEQLQPGLRQMIEVDYASGWLMYLTLVAIITFSILNTFLMSVLERTREFGIMLALGYRPFNIGLLIMQEAFMLTILALVIGTLIGLSVNFYFYTYGLTFEGMEEFARNFNMPAVMYPQISLTSTFTGPLTILVFTLISALYPAMKIRHLEPVEAMRQI